MPPDAYGAQYGVACCDCRDLAAVRRLLGDRKVNLVITSPPYASQRAYDPSSGFRPIAPDKYVAWYKDVAAVIEQILAEDGSYFLNVKEHAEDGERSLYVKDLALAHKRQWGWRFVDEFCWRKTDNGVPGGWPNRFKNAWEPVFHFTHGETIKFRPEAVGHASDNCFDYSPNNPKSTSGSGLLGTGKRGDKARGGTVGGAETRQTGHSDEDGRHTGLARPSNVVECKSESSEGSHSAPYPRALVEFFIRAFTDPGDIVFDPFLGSGTTMAAAFGLGRSCFGCEISPAYTDVIVRRVAKLASRQFRLEADGRAFDEVEIARAGQRDLAAA